MRISANRLAIENRVLLILLLLEAVDVGQKRTDKVLLLLIIRNSCLGLQSHLVQKRLVLRNELMLVVRDILG